MTMYYFEGSPIVAPLTIESNEPVFAVDTINLKQQRSSQGAQRWELSFQIQSRDIEEDYFVSMVTSASTAKTMIMPQLNSVDNKVTITSTGVSNAATAGSSSVTVNFASANAFSFPLSFDNAVWSKTRSSVTPDTILAPDGTVTGDLFVEGTDTTATTRYITRSMSFTAGVTYTLSFYIKAYSARNVRIDLPTTPFGGTTIGYFNPTTGTMNNVSSGAVGNIVDRGNGWYQISITKTATTSGTGTIVFYLVTGTTTISYIGDGVSGIYIWGAQLLQSATATPYTLYKLPKGTFIKFSNHNKIYMTTENVETNGGFVTLNLYPSLRSDVSLNTSVYHAGSPIKPTLQYYRDLETLQGITYEDGILVNPGTIKVIEAL